MRRALVGLGVIIAVIAITGQRAEAQGEVYGPLAEGVVTVVVVTELLMPDVRLELGTDDSRWVLSWPVVLASASLYKGDEVGLKLHPFIEPQIETCRDAVRFAFGARVIPYQREKDFQIAPALELGGLLGLDDGNGGFVGVGAGLGVPEIGIGFGLTARLVQTTQERRYDIALDLHIPLGSDGY